ETYGFYDTHFSDVARRCPHICRLSAKKLNLPKLEFFNSIGISSSDLPKVLLRRPMILVSSLENQIIPCYDYLRKIPFSKDHFIQFGP
ncbi:hypothetical protein F511_07199, partial [Dorcoceras hygrometricum]